MAEEITVDGLQLGAMRVVDLRDALKERDLPTDGKKAVLLERLTAALQSTALHQQPEPEPETTTTPPAATTARAGNGNSSNNDQPEAMDEDGEGAQAKQAGAHDEAVNQPETGPEEQNRQEPGPEEGCSEDEEADGPPPVTVGVIVTESADWGMSEQVAPAATTTPEKVAADAVDAPAAKTVGEGAGAEGGEPGKEEGGDDTGALAAFVASMNDDSGGGGTAENSEVAAVAGTEAAKGGGINGGAVENPGGASTEASSDGAGTASAAGAAVADGAAVAVGGGGGSSSVADGVDTLQQQDAKTSGKSEADSDPAAAAMDVVSTDENPGVTVETNGSSSSSSSNKAAEVSASSKETAAVAVPAVVPAFTAPSVPAAAPAAAPASQDTYAYEEEQERVAMLKNLHQPMRRWYNEDYATNRARFGNFPMFWQDLATWPAMKEAKRLYLIATERRENPEQAAANDAAAAAEAEAAATAANATIAAGDSEAAEKNPGSSAAAEAAGGGAGSGEEAAAAATTSGGGGGAEGEGGEKAKKRKKRWGDARKSRFADNDAEDAEVAQPSNKRKSRWSADGTTVAPAVPAAASAAKGAIPGMPVNLSQEQIQETLVLRMRLQQANEKLATVEQDALLRSQDPDRSPSPPPRYDGMGVRTNTRDVRMREALNKERTKVIEEMMKLNPMFTPPPDFVKSKPHRKLYIPTDEYPGYNFIGLIIGPRGNTQKRMERETDCKIAIRGKGSVKEGARRGPTAVDADDELHVYISGESEEAVEKAAIEVGKLLRPLDDEQNEHKQKQLRELALINGTLREEDYCNICGEKGHRQFECPKRAQTRSATVEVRCALCGDTSHPTRDCLLHKAQQKTGQPGHEASLDKEYLSFMAELGDGDGAGGAAQLGPRPNASASTATGDGSTAAGSDGSSDNTSAAAASKTAPITNHYVWTPPTPVARPVQPPTAPPPARPTFPSAPARVAPPPSANTAAGSATAGPAYAQNTQSRPPGAQKSPFSRGGTPGVGTGGAPLLPPPERPPLPPLPPAVVPPAVPQASGLFQHPPLPPSQPPTAASTTSTHINPASSGAVTAPTPAPVSPAPAPSQHHVPAPPVAPSVESYGYTPPPLPPAGVYAPPAVPPAYNYTAPPPPQPPVPQPSTWSAATGPPPPPQPPLPPSSNTGYAAPPLPPPPAHSGAPPAWSPGYPQYGFPPPLPPAGGEALSSGQGDQNGNFMSNGSGSNDSGSNHFAGSPPLPPPPLPGQPPLPPG